MNLDPYTSPKACADAPAIPSHPAAAIVWLGGIACGVLLIIGSMYCATVLVSARDSITLTGMLSITAGATILWFKLIYTALLLACVVSYARGYRVLALIASVLVAVVTTIAVARSLMVDYRPSFYEWYVGETVTVVAAILLSVATAWP